MHGFRTPSGSRASGTAPAEGDLPWPGDDDGTRESDHCDNWTEPTSARDGNYGQSTAVNGAWTDDDYEECDEQNAIHCFEIPSAAPAPSLPLPAVLLTEESQAMTAWAASG